MSQFNYAAGQVMGAANGTGQPRRRRPGQNPVEVLEPPQLPMPPMTPMTVRAMGALTPAGGSTSRATPSGPVLARRAQREQALTDQGIDPTMLRQELQRRRTTDSAMLRQRRALGRKAQMLEAQGDRVGAEQTRAEIELLEGARREAAGETARSSALIRGGESRLQDTDTVASIRRNQDVTRRRNALGEQAEDLDMTIAGRGLEARDLQSQAGLVGARTGLVGAETDLTVAGTNQREAGVLDDVSAGSADTRRQAGVADAQNRLLEIQAREQELQDQIANGQGDRDMEREMQALEVERIREEQRLARLRSANEANAEEGTADARLRAAQDRAEAEAIRAQQERERLEQGGPAGDPITAIFGEGATPQERTDLVATIRTDVESVRGMATDQEGVRGMLNFRDGPARPVSTENNIIKIRAVLDNLANRRTAFTPEQYEAYVAFVRQEMAREVPDWVSTDAPFTGEKIPRTTAGGIRNKAEANSLWARLRAELGLSGGGGA